MKVIYKITYPNGKIYVGKDLTGTVAYFGSVDSRLIQNDFTLEQCRDITVRKEILWEPETATNQEVNAKEVEFILKLRSNDPAVGYNRRPKFEVPASRRRSASLHPRHCRPSRVEGLIQCLLAGDYRTRSGSSTPHA
jgi:hypothetical protein